MEKTLQDICREAKEYQHLTTQDLADLTDLSSSTISNYFSASSKDPSLYKMGLICAALGVSIDEYFGIVKRPTTEEQLAEAHRAMADADAKHSAALRIAHLEGGMEQLTGSVAKHEKKERVLQIWVYILAFSLSIAVSIIFGYLAFDSSVPHTGLIRNGQITSIGWMLFALLAGKDLTERYNMTFAQVFDAWKEEHYKKIGPNGIEGYDGAFKIFAPLHDRKFRDLKTADFQGVLDAHMHKSHSTVSKYKQLITQMSTWAMREEIITTNFAKFVQLPENTKKEKETFTDAEISKLKADGSDTAKIILMLIYTGMRIGELFALPAKDYHKDYVVGGEKTEAGRNRIIPIRPEGIPYFAYFANKATGPLLISGYAGEKIPANFRRRDYYPLLEKLKIQRKTPHSTRHTYASWARKAGIAPEMLQRILGHANYSTTANIYVHTSAEELVQAVKKAKIC